MRRGHERMERARRLRILVLLVLLAAGLFAASPGAHGHEHADHDGGAHACVACTLTPIEPPQLEPALLELEPSGWLTPAEPIARVVAPRRELHAPRGPPSKNS